MEKTVEETKAYHMTFFEFYLASKIRSILSCCCKDKDWYQARIKKLERHEKASDSVTSELDIVKQIDGHRMAKFLAKMSLKSYQRALISAFRRYRIEDFEQSDSKNQTKRKKRP
mgnify:CR=1 FL=1